MITTCTRDEIAEIDKLNQDVIDAIGTTQEAVIKAFAAYAPKAAIVARRNGHSKMMTTVILLMYAKHLELDADEMRRIVKPAILNAFAPARTPTPDVAPDTVVTGSPAPAPAPALVGVAETEAAASVYSVGPAS